VPLYFSFLISPLIFLTVLLDSVEVFLFRNVFEKFALDVNQLTINQS
jgi:hypothetical protein